ncbi:MAG: thioredoxin domain-containing protein [Aquificae bacterium]|nr:thioredoxin domain-containing protein [Aquificota bacterium]
MKTVISHIIVVTLSLIISCKSEKQDIQWYTFEEGITQAKKQDKLILLDIYAKWCHWCNVMENTTYRNKVVIKLIKEHYIPIRVDADQRPDLNKKYNQGGLPSTVILTPEAKIVYGTIYVPPEDMIKLLQQFAKMSKQEIQEYIDRNQMLQELHQKKFERVTQKKYIKKSYLDFVYKILEKKFDQEHGGFKGSPKFPQEELVYFLILYSLFNQPAKEFLEKTLHGYSLLIDKEEGGIYRYGTLTDWTEPHYEKLLKDQADISVMFFNAFSFLGKENLKKYANLLVFFMEKKLYDPKTGYFYNSQGADIVNEKGTLLFTGEEFFPKPKEEREKIIKNLGYSPKIDKSIYFPMNALASRAFLYSYMYNQNRNHLHIGIKTLEKIIKEGFTSKGIKYSPTIDSYYLNSQVYTLETLLVAYQITSQPKYLKLIKKLISILDKNYFSKKIRIYTDQKDIGLNTKKISFIDDIISLNARLCRVMYGISLLEGDLSYKEKADSIIAVLPRSFHLYTAVSYYLFHYSPLATHIIGNQKDKDPFLRYAFTAFPLWSFSQFIDKKDRKTLEKLGYKPPKDTTAYICGINICFKEETNPKNLKRDIFSTFKIYIQ